MRQRSDQRERVLKKVATLDIPHAGVQIFESVAKEGRWLDASDFPAVLRKQRRERSDDGPSSLRSA